jgi:hypothetical protein
MNTERTLMDIAVRLKEGFEAREVSLQRELQELEARQSAIQAELTLAANAETRLAQYRPGSLGDNKCPYCWMNAGRLSPIYPIGGGTRDEDCFRCRTVKKR